MARGNNPGKDFDDQFYASKRRGQEKARRGEGPWSHDKYLERNNERLGSPQGRHAAPRRKSCGEKAATTFVFLGGLAWGLAEAIGRAA